MESNNAKFLNWQPEDPYFYSPEEKEEIRKEALKKKKAEQERINKLLEKSRDIFKGDIFDTLDED